jgi:hypothetical protein
MVFDEIRQLGEERFIPFLRLVAGAKGEEFLKLVENEHRRNGLAVPGLKMETLAMEELPERFVGMRQRRLGNACSYDRLRERPLLPGRWERSPLACDRSGC